MKEIRLLMGAVIEKRLYIGVSKGMHPVTDMETFFASIALHKDPTEIENFFLEKPKANINMFSSLCVWESPVGIKTFKNTEGLLRHFEGDFHDGVIALVYSDGEWEIHSRVAEQLTNGFVPLHGEIKRCYEKNGYPDELIDNIFQHAGYPLVIDRVESDSDIDTVCLNTLYFDHPQHLTYEDNFIMNAVESLHWNTLNRA